MWTRVNRAAMCLGTVLMLWPAFAAGQERRTEIPTANVPAAVSGASVNGQVALPSWRMAGVIHYRPEIFYIQTPMGLVPYSPPFTFVAPGGGFPGPGFGPVLEPGWADPAAWGGMEGIEAPNLGAAGPVPPRQGVLPRAEPLPRNVERAAEMIVLGDRHFRAGDLRRASQRYDQALRADRGNAEVRFRLGQVALSRGDLTEAAHRLREAIAADPAWPTRASDAQALFAEPADFWTLIERLETHVQAHPQDRDAWLMLGAELLLSGRTEPARDIFLRLSDGEPDPTLAAMSRAAGIGP